MWIVVVMPVSRRRLIWSRDKYVKVLCFYSGLKTSPEVKSCKEKLDISFQSPPCRPSRSNQYALTISSRWDH